MMLTACRRVLDVLRDVESRRPDDQPVQRDPGPDAGRQSRDRL